MTAIDPTRVNLLESDIENYLYGHPEAIDLNGPFRVTKWLARQLKVHSGIIDLLGFAESTLGPYVYLVVVEVKNVDINPAAITQVCRYAADIERMCRSSELVFSEAWGVMRVIVGPSVNEQIFREAQSVNVVTLRFSVSLDLDINGISWNEEYLRARAERDKEVFSSDLFSEFEEAVYRADEIIEAARQPDTADYDIVAEFEEAIINAAAKDK